VRPGSLQRKGDTQKNEAEGPLRPAGKVASGEQPYQRRIRHADGVAGCFQRPVRNPLRNVSPHQPPDRVDHVLAVGVDDESALSVLEVLVDGAIEPQGPGRTQDQCGQSCRQTGCRQHQRRQAAIVFPGEHVEAEGQRVVLDGRRESQQHRRGVAFFRMIQVHRTDDAEYERDADLPPPEVVKDRHATDGQRHIKPSIPPRLSPKGHCRHDQEPCQDGQLQQAPDQQGDSERERSQPGKQQRKQGRIEVTWYGQARAEQVSAGGIVEQAEVREQVKVLHLLDQQTTRPSQHNQPTNRSERQRRQARQHGVAAYGCEQPAGPIP
jgi:hypothetical protein